MRFSTALIMAVSIALIFSMTLIVLDAVLSIVEWVFT